MKALVHGGPWPEAAPPLGAALLPDLACVALVAVLAWLVWRFSSPSSARRPLYLATAVILLVWLPVGLWINIGRVGGQWLSWMFDDELITLQYAWSWTHGLGLTWTPGEKVEGFSNPLWMFWMALLSASGIPQAWVPAVLITSDILVASALPWLTARLARNLGADAGAAGYSGLAIAFLAFPFGLSTAGWEVIPQAALCLWAFNRILEDKPVWRTGLLLGLVALLRQEAATISVVLGGLMLWRRRSLDTLLALVAGAMLPAAYLLFRLEYYGVWVANTVVLKTSLWPGRIPTGIHYAAGFLRHVLPLLALTALWAGKDRSSRAGGVAAMFVIPLLTVTLAGGDCFGYYRMLLPTVGVLVAATAAAIETCCRSSWQRIALAAISFVSLGSFLPGLSQHWIDPVRTAMSMQASAPAPAVSAEPGNIRIAQLLKPVCGNERVAEFFAGAVEYYSGCPGIDLLGKADPYVAHLHTVGDSNFQGHNKYDFDYSLGHLHPGYVIGWFGQKPDEAQLAQTDAADLKVIRAFYENQNFIRYCEPHQMPWQTWRAVYHCEWPAGPQAP